MEDIRKHKHSGYNIHPIYIIHRNRKVMIDHTNELIMWAYNTRPNRKTHLIFRHLRQSE